MTASHREPRLPKRAEELLEGWPAPSRGALEWEEGASAIIARIHGTEIGSTPDDLLRAPLPEEPDERGLPAPEAATAEPSLADIARATLSAAQAATREVAREGLIAAELGRKNPPREAAPAPRAVLDAAGLQGRIVQVPEPARPQDRPPPPPKIAKAPVAAAPVAEAMAHSEVPALPSHERRGRTGALLGSSVLALAAAAALYLSFARHAAPETHLTASAEAPVAVVGVGPEAPGQVAKNDELQLAPSASTVEQPVAELDSLAPAAKSLSGSKPHLQEKTLSFHVKKESASNAGKLVLEERDEAPAQNAAPPAAGAVQSSVLAATPLSQTPSTGAVQAALGSVLTSARGCLAGQDTGARAVVTFEGRTGRVKSVAVAGAEPGSPAESCVRSALMNARLPPFSEPTFTASITVRPL